MERLFKNYYLDEPTRTLIRAGVMEDKHLLKIGGGVPTFNAETYNKVKDKIDYLVALTSSGRKFTISKEDFEQHKMTIAFEEEQYYADIKYWTITKR